MKYKQLYLRNAVTMMFVCTQQYNEISLKWELEQLNQVMNVYTGQKATIHQLTTMLVSYKNVIFPDHNHLLTSSADDPILWLSPEQVVLTWKQDIYYGG